MLIHLISFYHITMLINISWLIPAKFAEYTLVTSSGQWHKMAPRSPPYKLHIPGAPGALPRWNQRKQSCPLSQAILTSFPLQIKTPLPQLREELRLQGRTLILSSIKRPQKMLRTNSWHYTHSVKSFFTQDTHK